MEFSQIFSNLLDERGISTYQMSKDTGISDSLIGYWKKGERIPKADNLLKIAEYLEISIDYLLGYKSKQVDPIYKLSADEQKCLCAFKMLIPEDKIAFIARMEQRYEDYSPETKESAS